jgi:hypothetical protein
MALETESDRIFFDIVLQDQHCQPAGLWGGLSVRDATSICRSIVMIVLACTSY